MLACIACLLCSDDVIVVAAPGPPIGQKVTSRRDARPDAEHGRLLPIAWLSSAPSTNGLDRVGRSPRARR
jgi:hypothetical protein